jgi:hypothetical protein
LERNAVYPAIPRVREVSLEVADAVARQGFEEAVPASSDLASAAERIRAAWYEPVYPSYVPAPAG